MGLLQACSGTVRGSSRTVLHKKPWECPEGKRPNNGKENLSLRQRSNEQIMKTVSIIIPMFNSEKYLPALFQCLDSNEFAEGDEILLVDNGSTDNTGSLCREKTKSCDRYRYFFYNEKADSYAARNYGIRHSSGEILVFTDSDCKPAKEWLSTIRNNIQPGTFIAGNVLLEIVENNVWECFDSITHLSKTRNNVNAGRVATANMAVWKSDLEERVGFFEERFAGGDFAWSRRAVGCGMKLLFLEKALVYHPSRKTYNEILTREKRSAYGAGKNYRISDKSGFILWTVYFLKIFKFDTYLKLAKQMRKSGIPVKEVSGFLVRFFGIRAQQLKATMAGFRGDDPRALGIK